MRYGAHRQTVGFAWLLLAAFLVTACTGTRETRTPIAVLVAGDAGSGAVIDVYASGLPPDPANPADRLEHLPSFRTGLAGSAVTLTQPTDEAGALRHVVHRAGDRDLVTTFDVASLDLAQPSSLTTLGPAIDVGERVASAGVFSDASVLCTVDAVASRDGRWLGVLHDGSACRNESSVPAVLLIELTPAVGSTPRVLPLVASTNDANAAPRIVTSEGRDSLAWLTVGATAAVRSFSLDAPRTPASTLVSLASPFNDAVALEAFEDGLVVASDAELVYVDLRGEEPTLGSRWSRPTSLPSFTGLRTVRGLPGTPVLAVTPGGVALYPDVTTNPDEDAIPVGFASGLVDAFVDPYGYAFALTSSRAITFDLLGELAAIDDRLPGSSASLAQDVTVVAGTWTFTQDTRGDESDSP